MYGSPGYVSDAIAACEQAIGRPCIVMGHSLGGVTAAIVMQQRPDLIRAAVPRGPAARHPSGAAAQLSTRGTPCSKRSLMRQSIPGVQAAGMSAEAVAEFLGSVPTATGAPMGESIEADGLLSMAVSLLTVDAAVLDPVSNGTIDLLLDADRGFDPPTLIITADPAKPDAVADPEIARHFAGALPPATEVVTIEGAGHLIHDEIASLAHVPCGSDGVPRPGCDVIEISRAAYARMVGAALDAYPYEACGLIAGPPAAGGGAGDRAPTYYPCTNAAASARVYTIDPKDHLRAELDADDHDWEINGVVHSHTHSEPYPSPTDVAGGARSVVALRDHQPQA